MKQRTLANRRLPREELRARIFDTAIALFRRVGYEAATVDKIAELAGVAKGTLFNFYSGKGGILLAYYGVLDGQFSAALSAMDPAEPEAALGRFHARAEALMRAEGDLVDAIVRQIAVDATMQGADEASDSRHRRLLTSYFQSCSSLGSIAEHADPAVAANVVVDLWSATSHDWVRSGKRFSLHRRLAAKLALLFAGLAPAAGARR